MTVISNTTSTRTFAQAARLLLVGASGLALSAPVAANELLFTTTDARPETGQRIDQRGGLTQIVLDGGGIVSIVDAAEYRINPDRSIDLYEGTITIAAGAAGEIIVRMPDGLEGRVAGTGAAGNFSVRKTGEASGHALSVAVRIGRTGRFERFAAGEMWRARRQGNVRRVIANSAQVQPDAAANARPAQPGMVVPISGDAGPVAAALNGFPAGFGDQLAAAGASSDIIAAARRIEAVAGNPVLDTFPSGDFALLVAAAARLEGSYGGSPFPQARADIIRTYLRFLAGGGARSEFLTAYSGFVVGYLDLLRAGGLPASFGGSSPADIEAYLAYIRRTGALGSLAARDQVLAEAYLAFLAGGGNRDSFAASFTGLTTAYFAFVRGGGDPAAFTGASEAALAQTIAFLRDSGLAAQLSAADRALIDAFLVNGGLAFAAQYDAALSDYFAFLASGRRPSDYTAMDAATLRAYLETLATTGLLETVLGERSGFYADYLAFLRAGGDADAFAGLPVNIFAGYAAQLETYRAFLAAGNLPSAFSAADPAQLQAFIAQLQAAGALERFLGADAAFFAAFADFVRGGGAFDAFGGLRANIFAGYASQLQAYFAFLERGGVPSTYAPLSQDVIAQYLAELQAAGALARFLPELGDFYAAYFAFLSGGGNPDTFASLPVPPDFGAFAAALNAYADFLAAGGLPADFTGQDLTVLASFIAALVDAGEVQARLGTNADLLRAYFAFIADGGAPNGFAGLPVYADYVTALNAYFAFLAGGGLPTDYAVLDQATINAYLAALAGAQGGLTAFGDLDAFFRDYFVFVSTGGNPASFAGLPVFAEYVAALNAYFAFLAGGGLPSAYTVLDQATINAYLAALAGAQGGLTGFATLNAFFAEYAIFLDNGGDPDQFAGLPVNGGGGGAGGNPDLAPRLAGALFLASFAGGSNVATGADVAVNADGQITDATINGVRAPLIGGPDVAFDARGWEVLDAGRFGNAVAFTSYLDRDSTLGSNFVLNFVGGVPTTVLPRSGLVNYRLVGGAAPTERDTAAGSAGFFDGNLAVAFGGAAPRVGLDFEVTSGATTFASGTAGGAADPLNGGMTVNAAGRFTGFFPARAVAGVGCARANSCSSLVDGGLFGEDAGHAGLVYFLNDASDTSAIRFISGSAIFGTSGDALAGLGTVPPGITPPVPTGTPLILANQSPFTATTGIKYNLRAPATGLNGFSADGVVADSSGAITAILEGFHPRSIGTATAVDVSTNARFAIGRWTNGVYVSADQSENTTLSATQGLHYLFAGPTTSGFAIPTTGRIDYDLIAATAPTIADGSLAPGQFQADMAVLFGATNRVAMEGSITMPRAGGDFVYGFSTQGGVANAEQSTSEFRVTQGRNINFSILGDGITTSDNSCTADCTISFAGYFAGADINQLGLAYSALTTVDATVNAKRIDGAAIFGNGTLTGPPVSAVTGNQFSATVTTDVFVSQGNLVSLDFRTTNPTRTNSLDTVQNTPGSFGYTTDADGRVIEIGGRNGWFDRIAPVGTNFAAASNTDIGRTASGAVRWSRWSNGGVVPSRFGPPPPFSVSANGGYHIVIGTPSANLPASGRVDYTLAGGTSPTAVDGSVAPGTLTSGAAAVQFGADPKVGISLGFDFNSNSYLAQTTGGVANLATSELSLANGGFTGRSANGSVTGGACAGACSVEWTGFLAGSGGTELGVQYDIRFTADIAVIGTAAFIAGNGSMGSGSGTNTASAGGPITAGAAPGGEWSRWTGSAATGANPSGLADGLAATGQVVPGTASLESGFAASERDAAIRQAERLMNGMISFPDASGIQR